MTTTTVAAVGASAIAEEPTPSTADRRPTRRRLGPGRRFPGAFWVGPIAVLIVWELVSATGVVSEQVLSSPWDVVKAFHDQWVNHGLLTDILVSLRRVAIGLAFGVALGTILALISGLSRIGESFIDGPIQIKRSIPTLALIPLFIAWFGIGEEMKLITIALISMIPVYINTHNGLRSIDGKYAELAETIGITRGKFVSSVILPGALPGFLLGMRFAVTSALLGLVVVEQTNATSGIGYMITLAQNYGETDVIMAGLVIYGVFGFAADALVRLIERKALAWRRTLEG